MTHKKTPLATTKGVKGVGWLDKARRGRVAFYFV